MEINSKTFRFCQTNRKYVHQIFKSIVPSSQIYIHICSSYLIGSFVHHHFCLSIFVFFSCFGWKVFFIDFAYIIFIITKCFGLYIRILYYLILKAMDLLRMRLNVIVEWINSKKNSIQALMRNNLPVSRSVKDFIVAFLRHMADLVDIIQRTMKDIRKNQHASEQYNSIIRILQLIRNKQLLGIQQWNEKLEILQNKNNQTKNPKSSFPDIFKDINDNIYYYNQLKMKIQAIAEKPTIKQPPKRVDPFRKYSDLEKNIVNNQKQLTPGKYGSKYDNRRIEQKDNHYVKPFQNDEKELNYFSQTQQLKDRARKQLSPYKLVNPKYNSQTRNQQYNFQHQMKTPQKKPGNETPRTPQRKISYNNYYSTSPSSNNNSYSGKSNPIDKKNDKYQQYRNQLLRQMSYQTFNKYPQMADSFNVQQNKKYPLYKNSTFEDKFYTEQKIYSDARYGYPNKNLSPYNNLTYDKQRKYNYGNGQLKNQRVATNNQEQSQKIGRKKYQYLFEEDSNNRYNNILKRDYTEKTPTKPKKQFLPQQLKKVNPSYSSFRKYERNNQDSLEKQKDHLGPELEAEIPLLFRDKQGQQNDLQKILTNSLMSSKKWDEEDKQKININLDSMFRSDSDNDSLNEHPLRQTGKFPIFKQTNQQEYEEQIQLGIKDKASQEESLYMSFGKY